ncbi:MAG: helix-turn-helix transcriptional regulator [Eubacteriales bacterium]|nr:helix-turn-helix transcriptional regulator [Eubacteriales bacterium]
MTLKDMRTNCGISQAELARISGINLRSLQDYEQGHKPIEGARGETLYRLSMALGVSIESILRDSCVHVDAYFKDERRSAERIMAYERAVNKKMATVVHFPIVCDDEHIDMSRIYPTKQRLVKSVIDQVRPDKRLNKLILFGSSITMRCCRDSDIDFAVGLADCSDLAKNEISEQIQTICDWNADILWLDRLVPSERVYMDIQKGMVLI